MRQTTPIIQATPMILPQISAPIPDTHRAGSSNNRWLLSCVAALTLAVAGFSTTADAADVDVYLQAQSFDKTLALPDGSEDVPMWGFLSCDSSFTTCSTGDAPGPQLDLSTGDKLTIHLKNTLPVPVSIVIPGQVQDNPGSPISMNSDSRRVQSFTHETIGGATGIYNWSSLRPGTYLYQSGTQPSIQVPMGLYGALIVSDDTAVTSYANTVLADNPRHYYRLGESDVSNLAVDLGTTGTTSDGTYGLGVQPGATLGYSSDKAVSFDGTAPTAYINTNVTTISNSAFSVEAWVNANDTIGQRRIVAKDEVGVTGAWLLWFNEGKLRFQVRNSTNTDWFIAEAPTTPPVGTTFHVVGVFDGTDVILYVDGAKVHSTPLGSPNSNSNGLPITIGADSDTIGAKENIFDGTIDEVAIYEAALTEPQIVAHYRANSYEPVMLFSEIDPVQNQRVADAAGTLAVPGLGTPTASCVSLTDYTQLMTTGYPCTIDYNPVFTLINGETSSTLSGGAPGNSVLMRLLNAGLHSHTPSIVGLDMALIAEDGNLYPGLPRLQSKVLLPAGKTHDAFIGIYDEDAGKVLMPAGVNATHSLFDRMPTFVNESVPNGGVLASVQVGTGSPSTPAPDLPIEEVYAVTEDTPLVIDPTGGNGVELISRPSNGTIVEIDDAGVLKYEYTPNQDFSGTDQFTYKRQIGLIYNVTLNVSFVNDVPVAAADGPFINTIGTNINVPAPGVLGNDQDVDGDTLTAVIEEGTAPPGLTLNPDGSFTYTGAVAETFSYRADDGTAQSAPVLVTLKANPVPGITLNVVDSDGNPVTDYRWLVQEDATYHNDPNAPAPNIEQQSLNFHKSYMPVIAQGLSQPDCTDPSVNCAEPLPDDPATAVPFDQLALEPAKHYYVSVLPNDAGTGTGHTMGGAQIMPGQTEVTVIVNNQEIPLAQISVLVFEDISPTNGKPDANEPGLGGFQIVLEDAGGRYGASGGTMSQDAFGNPLKNSLLCAPPGTAGVILSCPDGRVLIENLPPGKYGVIAVAPLDNANWTQTSTIEGSKVIDAWVKAGEPPFFLEFGNADPHARFGFVDPTTRTVPLGATGPNAFGGAVTLLHDPRPPGLVGTSDSGSYVGLSHTRAWVGLNSIAGDGENIQTVQADPDGRFSMAGIPDGTYQLVVWDSYLDQIIHFQIVNLPEDNGNNDIRVPVNAWFTRSEHNVFLDVNENGIRDDGEAPLPEQAINLRWRDGTVNQSFPTDLDGFVPFDQTFPFFHWQVLEVDYTRFKATGLTVTVDAGGDLTPMIGTPYEGLLVPQDESPRTETGQVLTQGFQGFPGQTSIFDWGKKPYVAGENGGISGIVFYGSTRGENDPRLTVGDPWEPGVPAVKVRLYREVARDPNKVDVNVDPIDDFPNVLLGDVDHNSNGIFEGSTSLVLVQEVETDSWDASIPTGCPGEIPDDVFTTDTLGYDGTNPERLTRCYDGWRNWNQARPAVFDGGYAFNDIPPGKYIVEVVTPPGYELIKEQDINVGFGDAFGGISPYAPVPIVLPNGMLVPAVPDPAMIQAAMGPEPGLAQPPCVGSLHTVPAELSLFPGMEAPFADADRPLCNRKEVVLSDQGQAAADFHLFTSTPVAAQFTGMITDDISSETDRARPGFGEKWSPAYLPFTIRDFKGQEVYSGISDAFGHYNGMAPSTFTANMPIPSGYSPSMLSTCLNDSGPTQLANFGTACYTWQYMPGATTYLDTPILPNAAFAAGFNPPDCSTSEGTPVIQQVGRNDVNFGSLVAPGNILRINSAGQNVAVPNPAYEGPLAPAPYNEPFVSRNFDFGPTRGTVELVANNGTKTTLAIVSWDPDLIRVTAPATPMTGRLMVTRGDNGNSSTNSATVTVSDTETPIRVPTAEHATIQDAIDAASPGDLILVKSGTYNERVVMWKPVRLQGSGSGTVINARTNPTETLQAWLDKTNGLIGSGAVDLLPEQVDLMTELGGGITVLAKNDGSFAANASRIDGFTITGAEGGGGVYVNAYADNLEIANNNITNNSGTLHGGIRIGKPFLPGLVPDGNGVITFNENVSIHDNSVTFNGARHFESAGGGVSLSMGSTGYNVSNNFICGNFTAGDGAGIGHLGVSNDGTIAFNKILFNQSYNQGINQHGGGLLIAGEPVAPPALSLGSGNVLVDANLIQGNQAGSGHGGGIRAQLVNGAEIALLPKPWRLRLTNNMIVNNVAAWAGAGISLQDTIRSQVVNNTVANNDSTATVGGLIVANASVPQPAGIVAERHSPGLAAYLGTPDGFSSPLALVNNIVWHNRAFSYGTLASNTLGLLPELAPATVGECATGATYWDLGVLGEPPLGGLQLDPRRSILSNTVGYNGSNLSGDPDFLSEYCNGARSLGTPGPMTATFMFGEDGNFIDLRFGPLTQEWPARSGPWDYHIGALSSGLNNGNNTVATAPRDFDNEPRPMGIGVPTAIDRGADEVLEAGMVAFTDATFGTLGGGSLVFGNITGSGFQESTITLSVSDNPVTFESAVVTNTLRNGFSLRIDTCSGSTVAVGSTCTITVRLRYDGGLLKEGALTVTDSGSGSPRTLKLTGL